MTEVTELLTWQVYIFAYAFLSNLVFGIGLIFMYILQVYNFYVYR